MTLEDFFTLSELSNGLTTPSRIRELVATLEKVTDFSGKNINDMIRQWSAVARAISATDSKDCLDLFVQIHGLNSVANWLNHYQKLANEESNSSIEDTITHLLQALDTFQVDRENLIDSKIWTTVKDLRAHSSPKVHSKARVLYEKWEKTAGNNEPFLDNEKAGDLNGKESGEIQDVKRGSDCSESSLVNTHPSEETSAEEEQVNDLPRDNTLSANKDNVEGSRDGFLNNVGSKLDPFEAENTKYGSSEPPHSSGTTPVENSPIELPSRKESNPHEGTSAAEIGLKNLCNESTHIGLAVASDGKSPINGTADAKECDGQTIVSKSSSCDKRLENMKELRQFHMGVEVDGKPNRRDLLTSGCDLANSYGLGRKHTDRENAFKHGRAPEFGIVDPLEVARQVAIEVEREVIDYRDQHGNSSDKLPRNNMEQPCNQEAVRGETSRASDDDSPNETKSNHGGSDEDSKESTSENSDAEQRDESEDVAISPQEVTETAKTEINAEKVLCGFDLNQISSEDVESDHPHPFFSPVSMVSASRPTAAPGLPIVPLQFEGNLGWKGIAATSAFKLASLRRVPDTEKQLHAGESSGSKKCEPFLGFDLNVAESVDPRESLPDLSSRRSKHMGLDLNNVGESVSGGGGTQQDWLFGKLVTHQSSSHSPSLSKQPMSFIDLNDQPSLLNNSDKSAFSRQPPQIFDAFGSSKSTEAGFSIFGAKFEIGRKDNILQTMPLSNGPTSDLAFSAATNMGQQTRSFFGAAPPMVQYANPSVYGYNNIQLGQAMPLSSAMYGGPIPYVVDSRGATVIPQIMGSSSAFQNPFSQQPFAVSMNPSNGAGSSRSTPFDLNSGSMVEGSSKDTSSFGPFLNLGHVGSMDEQLRNNSQHSGGTAKRKEPENGWENYGLRPYTPPWK